MKGRYYVILGIVIAATLVAVGTFFIIKDNNSLSDQPEQSDSPTPTLPTVDPTPRTENPTPPTENTTSNFTTVYTNQSAGTPTIDFIIGTPEQHMPIIFDTGSFITNLACDPCATTLCDANVTSFDTTTSSSFDMISCDDPICSCYDPQYICNYGCSPYPPNASTTPNSFFSFWNSVSTNVFGTSEYQQSSESSSAPFDNSMYTYNTGTGSEIFEKNGYKMWVTRNKHGFTIEIDTPDHQHFSTPFRAPIPTENFKFPSESSNTGSTNTSPMKSGMKSMKNLRSLQTNYYCSTSATYLDGTTMGGPFISETINFGSGQSNPQPSFNYSMMMCDFEYDDPGSSGIMGAAMYTPEVEDMVPQAFMKNAGYPQNLFGVCNSDGGNGVITFGGYNTSYFKNQTEPIKWVSVDPDDRHFTFPNTTITFGSQTFNGTFNMITDTGSTINLLPSTIVQSIYSHYSMPYSLYGGDIEDFNGVVIFFGPDPRDLFTETMSFYATGDTEPFFTISPEHMFWDVGNGIYYLSCDYITGYDDVYIIGNVPSRGHYVLHDVDNHRMAYVPSACPYI